MAVSSPCNHLVLEAVTPEKTLRCSGLRATARPNLSTEYEDRVGLASGAFSNLPQASELRHSADPTGVPARVAARLSWEAAHLKLAERKFSAGDYKSFLKEINAATDEYPFDPYPFEVASQLLVNSKMFPEAYHFLVKLNELKPGAYSTKWVGIIDLLNNRVDSAINYLSKSINYYSSDAQVYYNLAGAYSIKKDFKTALQMINRCLQIEPNYSAAKDLQQQLLNVTRINN